MNWLAVVLLVLKLVDAFVEHLTKQKLIEEATATIIQQHLKGALDEVQKANAVRDAVRRDFKPDELPDDDPNQRP